MKDDLPYFSHDNDSRNHPKMKALRARYGWTGYGQFWALNEMIAGSAEARLDLSRKVVRSATACELGMTTDALDDFLSFLANEDECGLINYENGVVTTDRTQEDFERVSTERDRKRGMGKTSAEKRGYSAEKSENSAEEPNRIEESRVEETIPEEREETTGKPSSTHFQKPTLEEVEKYCLERRNGINAQHFIDYYEVRGWLVGKAKTKMKDWKAAVRTWESSGYNTPASPPKPPEEYRPKSCPKCGARMTGLSCPSCYTNFDSEGNEV